MDIFIEWPGSPDALGKQLEAILESSPVKLKMISNRGTKVYPPTGAITDCVDQFRCRLVAREAAADLTNAQLQSVIAEVGAHLNWAHVEKLQEFDGSEGFTKAQGED
jgi:isocitrate dehydrogenase